MGAFQVKQSRQGVCMKLSKSLPLIALCAVAYAPTAASAAPTIKSYCEFKKPAMITIPGDISLDTNGESAPVSKSATQRLFRRSARSLPRGNGA